VITSLPLPARAAIEAGRSADIRGNRIYGAAYVGIWTLADSVLSGNHIEQACLVLDDCSAIYTSGANNNSTIENNTVLNILGGLSGKPAIQPSQSQGIYLDELSSGVAVRGNTVVNASNGIQLHNAANNQIENNTLYNNRRHHVWLQEGSNLIDVEGDIFGNVVQGNRFFSTWITDWDTTAVGQWTTLPKDNTHRFANYDSNVYFTMLSPKVSLELWPSANITYTFEQWRIAADSSGLPRNLDPKAVEVNNASLGTTTFHMTGTNILPNGNLNSGTAGWIPWNKTAPYGQMVLETCAPANQCLRYTAGSTESLLSSPKLSVQKDQWYKVTFDLKTLTNGQVVSVLACRGGGGTNGYESLMGASAKFTGATDWKRYSFSFKALNTINVNDPVTLDLGARIDFTGIMPGQNLSVANLEVVPLSYAEANLLRSHILINPTGTALDIDCPEGGNAVACSEYVRFTDSQVVTWPYTLPPHGSEIIYSRDSKLTDGDRDGIPDYQDNCSATGAALAVNATGCTLGQ
jgi:parallel beta-helix repeat protein